MTTIPRRHAEPGADLSGALVDKAIERSSADGRNNSGFWLACQARDNGLAQSDAEALAEVYAASVGDRTYTRREALSSVRSAYRRPAREPWGVSSHLSQPRMTQAQRVAEFRRREFQRLMGEARSAAQRERIARRRGEQLIRSGDFSHSDWETIDAHCNDDHQADQLVEAATWIEQKATPEELRSYRVEVGR